MNTNQLESMLKLTANRLGTTPDALKTAAEKGDFGNLTKNMDAKNSQNLRRVLNNPDEAKKLLSTPQAKQLFDLFSKYDK